MNSFASGFKLVVLVKSVKKIKYIDKNTTEIICNLFRSTYNSKLEILRILFRISESR